MEHRCVRMQIATEWMRHHVEEETLLQEQAAGGQPASPQRLIDSLISLSAQDATCSRLGTELRTLLANIIPPQRSVLQHQLQRQQVQDVEMAVVDAAPNSGPVGGTGTDAVSAPMSTLANPHSTSKPGENPLAIEAAASPRLSEPQGRLLASPGKFLEPFCVLLCFISTTCLRSLYILSPQPLYFCRT